MRGILSVIGVTLIMSVVLNKQAPACPGPPTTGEKRASLYVQGDCDFENVTPVWTCTAATGTYKIRVGVTSIGTGGTYIVAVFDQSNGGHYEGGGTFTATGTNCNAGDFTVDLINGHEYSLYVDASTTSGCASGEHAWAKMCYTCSGS